MQSNNTLSTPDLNLVYILGFILKSVPLSYLQPFLRYAMQTMVTKHSDLFTRLNEEESNLDFIIDAKDIPFNFYMKPNVEKPILLAIKKENNIEAKAVIKGTLEDFLLMLEGKLDGDAAFFSKRLQIEGKTEYVVALRNAIDSVDVNVLEDLITPLHSSLQGPLKYAVSLLLKQYQHVDKCVKGVKEALTSKIEGKLDAHEKDIDEIKQELYQVKRNIIKATRGPLRKKV